LNVLVYKGSDLSTNMSLAVFLQPSTKLQASSPSTELFA